MTTITATSKAPAALTALVDACRGGDHASVGPLCDYLTDTGHDRLAGYLQRLGKQGWYAATESGRAKLAEYVALYVTRHFKALELFAVLDRVDVAIVPVMSTDRRIGRKDQAKLARGLFKRLGLRHLSVTTPQYSMASTVDITYPTRRDYAVDQFGEVDNFDPTRLANREAERQLAAILEVAFPEHKDRSDSASDYFDACWHISGE